MNHQGTSRDRMLRMWPRITVLNNYSPKWYRERKRHDSQRGFIHFHPIYYLKGDRVLGNSILRNSSSECQNQDQAEICAYLWKNPGYALRLGLRPWLERKWSIDSLFRLGSSHVVFLISLIHEVKDNISLKNQKMVVLLNNFFRQNQAS